MQAGNPSSAVADDDMKVQGAKAIAFEAGKVQRSYDEFERMHDAIFQYLENTFIELNVSPGLMHVESEHIDGKLTLVATVKSSRCVMGNRGLTFKAIQSSMATRLGLDLSLDRFLVQTRME